MTEKKKQPVKMGSFYFKGERQGFGMCVTVGGVIGVGELSDERILLVSHSARLEVGGEGLSLTVLEGRCAQINGRVREMRLLYGKN